MVCLSVITKPQQLGGLDPLGLSNHEKTLSWVAHVTDIREIRNACGIEVEEMIETEDL